MSQCLIHDVSVMNGTSTGVHLAALSCPREKFRLPNGDAIEMMYTAAQLGYPTLDGAEGRGVRVTRNCIVVVRIEYTLFFRVKVVIQEKIQSGTVSEKHHGKKDTNLCIVRRTFATVWQSCRPSVDSAD